MLHSKYFSRLTVVLYLEGALNSYQDNLKKISQHSDDTLANPVYIYEVIVDIKEGRQGYGTKMISSIKKDFEKSTLIVDVVKINESAINFYKKNGFTELDYSDLDNEFTKNWIRLIFNPSNK